MSGDCECCEGVGVEAPDPLNNPPGLDALSYRVGTHTQFFHTMMARLSVLQAEQALGGSQASSREAGGCLGESHRSFLLGGDPDAATALLDGWACIADLLTFYQERIANEGYLRTATEERSVIELGRLTGYEPRPGVAASVHLAFTVQEGFDGEIPERTRTQSLPRPGQTAQMFETSQAIGARAEWNAMVASGRATGRYIRREHIALKHDLTHVAGVSVASGVSAPPPPKSGLTGRIEIFLHGTGQNVQAGDVLLVEDRARKAEETPRADEIYRVSDAWPHPETQHTTLRLVPLDGKWERGGEWDTVVDAKVEDPFAKPAKQGAAAASMVRARRALDGLAGDLDVESLRVDTADRIETMLELIGSGMPELREQLTMLLRTALPEPAPRVYVMRVRAQVFGHASAPMQEITNTTTPKKVGSVVTSVSVAREHEADDDESSTLVHLSGEFAAIRAGTVLVMRAPPKGAPDQDPITQVFTLEKVDVRSRLAYGAPGKATTVELDGAWWDPDKGKGRADIKPIRRTLVYAQPEPLALVGEPLDLPVADSTIDLDRAVADLPADRLVIVEGERDLPGIVGIRVAEVARVASSSVRFTSDPVPHRLKSPSGQGEVIEVEAPDDAGRSNGYTRIALATPLRYRYRRSTVVVRGNVVHATHGETRDEILGSGDASLPEQRFTLRQGPRTWESAPTPTGVASSLSMRVSGVLWPEVPAYQLLGPRDEVVRSRTLSDRKDEIRGGDGRRGARLPTGIENLTARYRVGLGSAGNVDAGLISALVTRPIGVREVINPVRSSGGADPDERDAIRMRIPIAASSIDRLVSVRDHAAFALNFAGIDKATAREHASIVEVVVAGGEDVTLDAGSDLLRNLRAAFHRYGDPLLRSSVRVAKAVPLLLHAAVRIDPRYDWPQVEVALRERLLLRQGWDARAIGEPAHLSVVLEALQAVEGVRSIDVDLFGPQRPDLPKEPPVTVPSGTAPAVNAPEWQLLLMERRLGMAERLKERNAAERRWAFAAAPDEILCFARSAPANVAFVEVAS